MARLRSNAELFLERRPDVRLRVEGDAEYTRWRDAVPRLMIEGVAQFFPEGDIQKEEDDLIVEFAIRKGLVSPDEVDTNNDSGGET
jgi:hypothetical protein